MSDEIIAAEPSEEMFDYLLKRRSCPIKTLKDPGPDKQQIEKILQAASHVPDHGKLFPWYFMVFSGDAREVIGDILQNAWVEKDPNVSMAKLELEAERFLRVPVVIGVISRIRESKHPAWEQFMSAGAVCQNLCLAANALGFGTYWVTEWYAYNDTFRAELGMDEHDRVAGFIYIGTPDKMPEERERPDLNEIVTYWDTLAPLKKGENYGHKGMGYPEIGFRHDDALEE